MTLWEIDIYSNHGHPDIAGSQVAIEAMDLGLCAEPRIAAGRSFLVQGNLTESQVGRLATNLLADPVVESTVVAPVGDEKLCKSPHGWGRLIHVLLKPGVMDPIAESTLAAMSEFDVHVDCVRTMKKYWIDGLDEDQLMSLCRKVLANDAIEQVIRGPLTFDQLQLSSPFDFHLVTVPFRKLDDEGLRRLSHEGQLYLSLVEMRTIQEHFRKLNRDPTDIELETLAQTWSEHCSHKTLAGRIKYRDENGTIYFDNMLKETIFAATEKIRARLGNADWCVSVFEDNAGIVRFDGDHNVVFKVETHNHPSALEPYGGANTGIGGVIRDTLGTGLGAQPVCNTDVFCFAPPDLPADDLPSGILHPRRVMKGVVAGVRDYGNRMGIPTVNGAVYFDPRYLGNPLVYCGNVGIVPCDRSQKEPHADDWIVTVGGRTGRDGIHGATFSSTELHSGSESVSGGAVQIGNAITEKMIVDVLLKARDDGLFHAITDCGAGGFSSAVGEMGEKLGADVQLENAPLKYDGLSYTEIWISEAQERMVLSVPPKKWEEFQQLCQSEDVEATILGRFVDTGQLQLNYRDVPVANLSMEFLHGGRPPVVREAVYTPLSEKPLDRPKSFDFSASLHHILGSLNVASKHWIIRQYDHEVQGGSVIKPLVGHDNDGPSDAAVFRPILSSRRGLVVACGMNPRYGDFDTYHMASSAMDEAVRNCVAVGADPCKIAVLDNFCWGNTDRPETLGSLVRAAIACHDTALALETPFISGKDSLNNEFAYQHRDDGTQRNIVIPPSLLISALGQIDDVGHCVTMDLKQPGNAVYQIGCTHDELGGSHYTLVEQLEGGRVPCVDAPMAKKIFTAVHQVIRAGCVRACHDLSEGGLAVAAAEMAFAGGWGLHIALNKICCEIDTDDPLIRALILLFSESNSRFLCEVPPDNRDEFEQAFSGLPYTCIGNVTEDPSLVFVHHAEQGETTANIACRDTIASLKHSWQKPLNW